MRKRSVQHQEKDLVENEDMLYWQFNYVAMKDRIKNDGIQMTINIIIKRIKQRGCYLLRNMNNDNHSREGCTAVAGD